MDQSQAMLYIQILGFISLLFVFVIWKLRSFMLAWFNVMKSGGSKVLVCVRNDLSYYYRAGRIDGDFLYYKARKRPDNKDPNRMIAKTPTDKTALPMSEALYRSFGVNCVDVDDAKNCFIAYKNESYHSVSGYNAEATDELCKTIARKPSLEDGYMNPRVFQIIVLCGIGLIAIGVIYLAVSQSNIKEGLIATWNITSQNHQLLLNMTGVQ